MTDEQPISPSKAATDISIQYSRLLVVKSELDHSFAKIASTAVFDCGMKSIDESERAWFAFLQWFAAVPNYPGGEGLVMLKGPVDKMWHAFILHTKLYREFCEVHLGFFLEHQPQPGFPTQASIERTVEFLISQYSTDISPLLAAWSPSTVRKLMGSLEARSKF